MQTKDLTDHIRKLLRRSYAEGRGPHGRTLKAVEDTLDKLDTRSRRVYIPYPKRSQDRVLVKI